MTTNPLQPMRPGVLLWGAAALLLAGAALLLLPSPVAAQCAGGPPPNDCFSAAIPVATNTYSLTGSSNVGSTNEAGEPSPCCGAANSIWWSWTPTISGNAAVNTCGSNFDTVLAAFTGAAVNALTLLAVNDDSCGLQSTISFPCTAGTTYRIQVTGFGGSTGGVDIAMSCTPAPPPGCGYTIDTNAPYAFVDITGTGTGLPHGDDSAFDVPLPFPFTYCGVTYNSVRTSSNGYVCLGNTPGWSCTDWTPVSIPSTSNPRPAIFAYYTDLYASFCSSTTSASCTSWQIMGTAPNRVFVYMQKAVGFCCSASPNPVTLEIKLFETTNCFEVHYQAVTDPTGRRVVGGYQDATGTTGYTYADSQPGFVRTAQAWAACPFGAATDRFTFNEDQPAQSFDVTANDNGAGTSIWVASNTAPSKGTVSLTPNTGIMTYQPYPDLVGADSFQYTITNTAGMQATGRVEITINPVNDAPSFTGNPTPIHTRPSAGPYEGAGWASNVVAGPPSATDEAGQAIEFDLVVNTNPALFLAPPTVKRTGSSTATTPNDPPTSGTFGVLRFEPASQSGTARLCFVARDSGGTAPSTTVGLDPARTVNGVDVSAAQQCVVVHQNTPPVAYFESDSDISVPGQAIGFNSCPGTGAFCSHDLEGIIVDYLWDFGDGSVSRNLYPSHAYASPGTYTVRLTVTDDAGLTATMVRTIRVSWPDNSPVQDDQAGAETPPVALAGDDLLAISGDVVRIEGSQRGGNDMVTFQWLQTAGPQVTLENPNVATLSFVAPPAPDGPVQLQFALRVHQGAQASAPDYVVVTVRSANQVPIAKASEVLGTAGETVTLDASQSRDPDGDKLAYSWEQEGGTPVVLHDVNQAKATFTAPMEATQLTFRLRVFDGVAASEDIAIVYIQAIEAAPAGARMEFEVHPSSDGATVVFTAIGVGTATWDFGDGSPPTTGLRVEHQYATGSYDATMRIGDSRYVQHLEIAPAVQAPARADSAGLMWALAGAAALCVAGVVALVLLRRGPPA